MVLLATPEKPAPGVIAFDDFGTVAIATDIRSRGTTALIGASTPLSLICLSSASAFPAASTSAAAATGSVAGVHCMAGRRRSLLLVSKKSVTPLSNSLDYVLEADAVAECQAVSYTHLTLPTICSV